MTNIRDISMVCAALGHGNQGPEVHMVTSALAAHTPHVGEAVSIVSADNLELLGADTCQDQRL